MISAYRDAGRAPGGRVRPSALHVVAQLADGPDALAAPARSPPAEAGFAGAEWGAWLSFASKVRDLGPDARAALTVWEVREGWAAPRPLGGATVCLYSKKGRLKAGPRTVRLWPGARADARWPSATPGRAPGGEAQRVAALLRRHARGELPAAPWLDALALPAARAAVAAAEGAIPEELRLEIELPAWPLPVLLHRDAPPAVTAALVEAAAEPSLGAPAAPADPWALPPGRGLVAVADSEAGKDSPAELKARKLARGAGRADAGAQPGAEERARLSAALDAPPTRLPARADAELLWRFRGSAWLRARARALAALLRVVDWADGAEAAEALALARRWPRPGVAEALELLGPDFGAAGVRALAVEALRGVPEEDLQLYLLHLVQALRHEPADDAPLARMLLERAAASPAVAAALFWCLGAELTDAALGPRARWVQGRLLETLAPARPLGSPLPSPRGGGAGGGAAGAPPPAGAALASIQLQVALLARLRHIAEQVARQGSAARRTDALRALLRPGGVCADLAAFRCPCPLDARVELRGVLPERCAVFRSKAAPLRIVFRAARAGESAGERGGGGGASAGGEALGTAAGDGYAGATYALIYKRGDDLRQDALVLRAFGLADRLLRASGLDLRLTLYAAAATAGPASPADAAAADGLVELVPAATPVAEALREHGGDLLRWLAAAAPGPPGAPLGVRPAALQNYLRSLAGYTVLTYVFGVGDRHMDNVMLCRDGRLLHVDFGYAWGADPKFREAPLALTAAMVGALGGPGAPAYGEMVSLACEAYNALRRAAPLLLALLALGGGGGGEGGAAARVERRLRLGAGDAAAAAALAAEMAAAPAAWGQRLAEMQHLVAQALR